MQVKGYISSLSAAAAAVHVVVTLYCHYCYRCRPFLSSGERRGEMTNRAIFSLHPYACALGEYCSRIASVTTVRKKAIYI